MKLVIVESTSKAKKIADYLGEGWTVEACRGHLRDLPQTELGVNIEQDFRPQYQVLPRKGNLVRKLVKAMRNADEVYLATDPDREGEAIAWHLLQLAQLPARKAVYRAAFNAITETAVIDALHSPRQLDKALVEAQQARRVVDRLVGYLVSPLACKALDGRLSAGRVQSVALRLVVEREREIKGFSPETHWALYAHLATEGNAFTAKLHRLKGAGIHFTSRAQAEKLIGLLGGATFWVGKAGQRHSLRNPLPPFTTSSMLQAASKGLGLSPEKTMALAQTLYEQGLITYHRSDAVATEPESLSAVRDLILRDYGETYLPATPPTHKTRMQNVHKAHECIRPTDLSRLPAHKDGDGAALYALIWKRFVASQMSPAGYTVTGALIHAGKSQARPLPLAFKVQARQLRFDGFLRVYEEPDDLDEADNVDVDAQVPALIQGQRLQLLALPIYEHLARPPSRFTEAALLKSVEALGLGRPSTYAAMVSIIQDKRYVTLDEKRLTPTKTGITLCDFLLEFFAQVFDTEATARLEDSFDQVAAGQSTYAAVLSAFWQGFQPQLTCATEYALAQIRARPQPRHLGETCPECGGDLVERQGPQGTFVGCSNYPACNYTRSLDQHPLVIRPAEG